MSAQDGPVHYLVIGHVTHDILPDGRVTPGGTVSYASLTAATLNGSVGVLTSAGPDFDPGRFNGKIQLVVRPAQATTTFENLYVNGSRKQLVHAIADPLTAADVPPQWQATGIVHIGPVLAECDLALLDRFAPTTFFGLTPQGWMRTRGSDHLVRYRSWPNAEYFLSRSSAVVLSIEDLGGDWAIAERFARMTQLLVVTTGARGGVLYLNGAPNSFPALAVPEVDPTGAGDIFAASFFTALAKGTPPVRAARFAACLASHSVTRIGLASVPQPDEIERCSVCLTEDEGREPYPGA